MVIHGNYSFHHFIFYFAIKMTKYFFFTIRRNILLVKLLKFYFFTKTFLPWWKTSIYKRNFDGHRKIVYCRPIFRSIPANFIHIYKWNAKMPVRQKDWRTLFRDFPPNACYIYNPEIHSRADKLYIRNNWIPRLRRGAKNFLKLIWFPASDSPLPRDWGKYTTRRRKKTQREREREREREGVNCRWKLEAAVWGCILHGG